MSTKLSPALTLTLDSPKLTLANQLMICAPTASPSHLQIASGERLTIRDTDTGNAIAHITAECDGLHLQLESDPPSRHCVAWSGPAPKTLSVGWTANLDGNGYTIQLPAGPTPSSPPTHAELTWKVDCGEYAITTTTYAGGASTIFRPRREGPK